MKNTDQILLVGAGPMAIEYAKVLKSLNQNFIVVGRSQNSAKEFEENTGVKVVIGGIGKFLKQNKTIFNKAIIAVSEEQLGYVACKLIMQGVKLILVEKPGGANFEDIKKVNNLAKKHKTEIYIAYNRRFYVSVKKAQEIIKKDGGILSILFDFTELDYKVAPLVKAPGVKENWFLHNSTHVIDLAFFLTGIPKKMSSYVIGSLPWHPKGAVFSGSGITINSILFSYHANWKAPGRWNLEIMTRKNKLIFKPLEKLQIQKLGSFEIKEADLDYNVDTKFKAGLYEEIYSFLGNKQNLCTISEQIENLKFYEQILVGKTS